MSFDDRESVLYDDFTGMVELDLLTDRPQWRSLEGTPSPLGYSGTAISSALGATDVSHGAIAEGTYTLSQYATMEIYDTDAGVGAQSLCGLSVGVRASGSTIPTFSGYSATVNGTDNNIIIFKTDPVGGDSYLLTVSYTPEQLDKITLEVQSDGSGGCDLQLYDQNNTLLGEVYDPAELTGTSLYLVCAYVTNPATMVSVEFGYLDIASERYIDKIGSDDTYQSNASVLRAHGAGLASVTGGNISVNDARPYELNFWSAFESYVDFHPVDIQDTQLPYRTLKLTLYHPEGNLSANYFQLPEEGWQYVVLSGSTGNYMDKDLGAVDGDQLEIPTGVQFSTATMFADGDVHYDGALNQGQTHERRFYDASNTSWDNGTVTINRAPIGAAPPIWRSTPAPPNATVGVPYTYQIGLLVDGDRPMTLSQAPGSVALPFGLTYNNITYPETITGTISSGSGTITVNGIITKAENGA